SNPSTNTSAAVLAPKVEILRIQNSDTLPGRPEVCIAIMPGTTPANELAIENEGLDFNSSTSSFVTAPVIDVLTCGPAAVTTTSSPISIVDSIMVIFRTCLSLINTSCISKPT